MHSMRPLLRRALPLGRALLAPVLLAACAPAEAAQEQSRVVAFVNATVIPMDRERVLERHTVVVRDGRIAQVGPSAQLAPPAGAQVVDAAGKFLIPGLAEMHAHIPAAQGGNMEPVERTLFLYLAGGVTTIRGMQGSPQHLELRGRAARGEILGPRVYAAGPALSGGNTPNAAAAAPRVREQKAAGYDLLKIQGGLSRESFEAIDATAAEVGIPFAGHVPAAIGLNGALRYGYASIDHLDSYVEALAGFPDGFAGTNVGFFGSTLVSAAEEARLPALAAATRAAGVAVVPTQTLIEHLASPEPAEEMARRPEMRYMPPATVAQWVERKRAYQAEAAHTPAANARFIALRRRLLKGLHDGGVTVLLGSDAPQWWNVPGFSARREAELMAAAGLTPYQVLESATRAPAAHLRAEAEWGTIQPGRSADLVLLDASPLQDVANLWRQAGVMVRGRWLPQAEIERRLEAIAASLR